MARVLPKIIHPILVLLFAVLAASASSHIQRFGPDHGIYCDIGKVNGIDVYCPKPKLNGGWPAPFLFDKPGISVEGKLTIIEDDFRIWPFIANVGFYLVIFYSVSRITTFVRQRF